MQLQVGVKVLLKNKEGKYLFIRRSTDIYQEVQHKWDIPGGRIDTGSPLLENLKREVMEETGLELSGEPTLIGAQDIFNPTQDRHIVRLTYIGEADGEPRLSEEHTEYAWLTEAEVKAQENLDKYFKELLDKGVIF